MTESEFIAKCVIRGLELHKQSSTYGGTIFCGIPNAGNFHVFWTVGDSIFNTNYVHRLGFDVIKSPSLHTAINLAYMKYWAFKTGDAVPNFIKEMEK